MRLISAFTAAALAFMPAVAASRSACYAVVIEGAGKVLLCAPHRTRRNHG